MLGLKLNYVSKRATDHYEAFYFPFGPKLDAI